MYTVILKKAARKQLSQLPRKDQERINAAIDTIGENPFMGKHLHGESDGYYSLRVWPYRIIYTIEKKIITVTVVAISHRQGIYKRISR